MNSSLNPSPGLAPGASDTLPCPPDRVRILRIAEICRRTALSPSTIYGLTAVLQFPLMLELGVRARGLPAHVLDAWLWARLLARTQMCVLRAPVALPFWGADPLVVSPVSAIVMLRRSEVLARVGLQKSALYEAIAAGTFPAPAPLTQCARRWAVHEVQAWIDERTDRSLRETKERLRRSNVSILPPPPRRSLPLRRPAPRSRSKRRRE